MAIEIYDIGPDKEIDRYTIIIDGAVFAMSENPLQACGFNQYCGELSRLPFAKQGRRIAFNDLPTDVQIAIEARK